MTDYPNNIPAKLEIIKASEIIPKEVRWLWYPYIPFGKVTLLQGDPGDGKSKLMLSLAALLSKGEPLPFADEEEHTEPMTVIYQTTVKPFPVSVPSKAPLPATGSQKPCIFHRIKLAALRRIHYNGEEFCRKKGKLQT